MNSIYLLLAALIVPTQLMAAPGVEIQRSTYEIIDPEYNGNNFVFSDRNRNLWLGEIDPISGAFLPENGQGLLLDTGAAFAADFGNGPEWMDSVRGKEIVYTKYTADGNTTIAVSPINGSGAYSLRNGLGNHTPIGSMNTSDTEPRIHYSNAVYTKGFFWSKVETSLANTVVPGSKDISGSNRRWVEGTHKIIFTMNVTDSLGNITPQVHTYDTDSGQLAQLTFGVGSKEEAYMWKDPRYIDGFLFLVMVDRTALHIYGKRDSETEWALLNVLNSPKATKYIWSPEPYVHNGNSYVSMVLSRSVYPYTHKIETWIGLADIFGECINTVNSPRSALRVRTDPEIVIVDGVINIYYNRYTVKTKDSESAPEGIWSVVGINLAC